MRRVTEWTAGAVLLALWSACYTEPLVIPAPSKIEYVEVVSYTVPAGPNDEESRIQYRIDDRRRVEAFVERLMALRAFREDTEWNQLLGLVDHSTSWSYMVDLFEPGKELPSLSVWIGPDWLDGLDEKFDKRGMPRRKLSAVEREELVAMLADNPH